MHRQWVFSGAREGWYWRATDIVSGAFVGHAQSCFATLFHCVRDAERHGYRRASEDRHEYRIGGWLPLSAARGSVG